MELRLLLMFFLALPIAASSQSTAGFISIDCGYDEASDYTEQKTNIVYTSDADYTDVGVNMKISPEINITGRFDFYGTLRSFPNGRRNCYTLGPVIKGQKYLARAEFKYGNFDGLNSPPVFDIYIDIHFWRTIPRVNFSRHEIIFVSSREFVQVCLVNKGRGTPYITVLELRPLLNTTYPLVNGSQALVLNGDRIDFGSQGSRRYPMDPFDRIWFGSERRQNWLTIRTNQTININGSEFGVPEGVLRTAVTTQAVSESLSFNLTRIQRNNTYVFMHFAEIQRLQNNSRREFDIFEGSSRLIGGYRPRYLSVESLYNRSSEAEGRITYSIRPTRNSTLPPLINALEVHTLLQLSGLPTLENDVKAISSIRAAYDFRDKWQGDPCVPKDLMWEGLNCSYDGSLNPRIVALNLSHTGINGGISPEIGNLTALVSVDLSSNNLTGPIPLNLGLLPELKFLNLADNDLSGPLPLILQEKSRNQTLLLRIDGNEIPCTSANSCESKEKKNKAVLFVAIVVPVFIIILMICIFIWISKRRKQNFPEEKGRFFTFEEIVHITKNFQKQIGKGSLGIVYYGQLSTGREVAVKMVLQKSTQLPQAFLDEAEILSRVHHKNLVSLLGYCGDQENLTLINEFMACGSLAALLSDEMSSNLSWGIRLSIALEVAQGLEYLHSFCKPPIVHGDVKTANILLNQKFEAKLSDFGLSRLFKDDDSPHIPAEISGTPSYIDPEYLKTAVFNEKSDVYSFGIILLELITGKFPIQEELETMSVVSWVKSRVDQGDIVAIVDQRLGGNYNHTSIIKAIDIAVKCVDSCSMERPTMSDVVLELGACLASMSLQDLSSCGSSPGMDSSDTVPIFHRREGSTLSK
ncbi:putative LRR receptor-like serine/threonine-protein kinase At4g29180 isoform X2 [Wolffia australiana]